MDDTIEKSDDLLTNKCLEDDPQCKTDADPVGKTQTPSNEIDWTFPEDQATSQSADASGARSSASRQPTLSYHLKWINWMSAKTPIVTQNLNGPCPLLAIINVMILKRKIQLPPMMDVITDDQLMEYLGDCILNSVPKVCAWLDLQLT